MEELKIRGKRKRREPQTSLTYHGQRLRGRPMKPISELLANKKSKLKYLISPKKPQPSISAQIAEEDGRLSHLEKLPTELIQQIFFHCLEVNMVKSSPVISKLLSTKSTYKLLILFAFFDDDGIHPVEANVFKPAEYRELPVKEKILLQEAILSCRWCSLKRVQDCMPTLTRLKMVQEWHKEHNITESWPTDPPPRYIKPIDPPMLPSLEDNVALEQYFRVHSLPKNADGAHVRDQTVYYPWLRPYRIHMAKDGSISKQVHRIRPGLPLLNPTTLATRHIPEKLLTGGPWNNEKLDFLKLLRQGFRHLQCDFILKLSPQALFRGMEDAIRENNPAVLLVLLELHDAAFHINETAITGHASINAIPHDQCYTSPSAQPLPLSLFHFATKHAHADASVLLSLLFRAALDSIPQDDSTITRWALHAAQVDSALESMAAFTLRYMEGAFSHLEGEGGGLFRHGAVSSELSPRYKFTSLNTFSAEIGYLPCSVDFRLALFH